MLSKSWALLEGGREEEWGEKKERVGERKINLE